MEEVGILDEIKYSCVFTLFTLCEFINSQRLRNRPSYRSASVGT